MAENNEDFMGVHRVVGNTLARGADDLSLLPAAQVILTNPSIARSKVCFAGGLGVGRV